MESNSNAAAEHQPVAKAFDPPPHHPASPASAHPATAENNKRQRSNASNSDSSADKQSNSSNTVPASADNATAVKDDKAISKSDSDTKGDSGKDGDKASVNADGAAAQVEQALPVAVVISIAAAATSTDANPLAASDAPGEAAAVSATANSAAVDAAQTVQDASTAAQVATDNGAEKTAAKATSDNAAIEVATAAIGDGLEAAAGQPLDKAGTTASTKPATKAAAAQLTTADAVASPLDGATSPENTDASAKPNQTKGQNGEVTVKKDQADAKDTSAKDVGTKDAKVETSAKESPTAAAPGGHHARLLTVETPSQSPDAGQHAAIGAPQIQPQISATLAAAPLNVALATTATAGLPLNGLAVEISAQAQIGRNRFEIRLDPPDLGRIDVRLDVDNRGQVTSHLTVEKPETLDLLRRDAPQLQRALEDAGLKTSDSGLQFSLRDQSSSRDNGSARNSQHLIISEDDIVPAEIVGRNYSRVLGSSSGIDIRI